MRTRNSSIMVFVHRALLGITLCLTFLTCDEIHAATEPDPEGIRFFEQKIRPVLIEHCYECHASSARIVQGGLLLETRENLETGGDSGPAIVPGNPDESPLYQSLLGDMPPSGVLPENVVADFKTWIEMGAPDPRTGDGTPQLPRKLDIEAGRQFWSFQPPQPHVSPDVVDSTWARTKIDRFILNQLESQKLVPADEATKRQLLRRLSLDLHGMAPSAELMHAFTSSEDPLAYEQVVDEFLASPRYGERWGRHWLDVVRFAEDNVNMGPFNGPYPYAWRYRDWVVKAMNDDLPFDDFLRRQIAADLQPNWKPEDLPALGMLGLSPLYHKELLLSIEVLDAQVAEEWEDRVDVMTRGLMGLTVACARCHDHKFDPITAKDYHAIAGVFASIRQTPRPIGTPEQVIAHEQAESQLAASKTEVERLKATLEAEKKKAAPAETTPPEQSLTAQSLTEQPVEDGGANNSLEQFESQKQAAIELLTTQLEQARQQQVAAETHFQSVELPLAHIVTEEQQRFEADSDERQKFVFYPNKPRDLPVFIRGNLSNHGDIVPRRFIEVLSTEGQQPFQQGSGRFELAEAIVSPQNPLTARVIVNRIWLGHFGEGLVDSPSNFGMTGSAPSHPELLDDLTWRFMHEMNWSLKRLHREIVLSAVYRQSSQNSKNPLQAEVDPANRLLSVFPRRRLEAEFYHDVLVQAGSGLELTLGGESMSIDEPDFQRRGIYGKVSRQAPSKFLQIYDFPDPTIHSERRAMTTSPLQMLFVMNSPFILEQSRLLAARIGEPTAEAASQTEKVTQLHWHLFARNPEETELEIAKEFLSQPTVDSQTETTAASGPVTDPATAEKPPLTAWEQYCQALLCSNELLFID